MSAIDNGIVQVRVDFSRLPRTEEEREHGALVQEFVEQMSTEIDPSGRALKVLKNFSGSLPAGHVLDKAVIDCNVPADSVCTGLFMPILRKVFPEANLLSWDVVNRKEGTKT